MRQVVVDTSALVRLYVPDGPMPEALPSLVAAATRAEVILLAPELWWAELGQVLWRKETAGLLRAAEVDLVVEAASQLPIESVPHRALLPEALRLARSTGLTVYDALFLALARARGADLVTADDRLAEAARR